MATVAELVRQGDLYMQFINYHETYHDNNKEFLRGDMWELNFVNVPKIEKNCLNTLKNCWE